MSCTNSFGEEQREEATISTAKFSKAGDLIERNSLETLSPEVLGLILDLLPAKTLLNLSETCRILHSECLDNGAIWKELFKLDFGITLVVKGQFDSFHDVYRLIYKSKIIFDERHHVTFSGMLPDWMFTWCTLSTTSPNMKFFLLPTGKAKKMWGLTDDELPRGDISGSRRSIAWTEAYDAAVAKWGSEASFQEQVLRKLYRSTKKVDSIYPEEMQGRRKRYYKKLRLGDKYALMENVLVKNKSTHTYLSYFDPQLIGEHYIHGKLHRFGRKQLREYMRFATKLYDHARASVTEFSESDLVQCVLLTYLDLAPRVENHFVKWKEFFDYSLKFLSRQQKVWKWQTEKGMCHQLQHRSTEKVQSKKAYREFIHTGDVRKLRFLRRHFEGLEKISEWVDMNYWVLDVLDTPVKETLIDRDNIEITLPDRNSAAKDLQRKIKLYLMSGKNQDFRVVLSTIASIARNRLRHSATLIEELEGIIKNDDANLLVSVETELFVKNMTSHTHGTVNKSQTVGMIRPKLQARKRKVACSKRMTRSKRSLCDVEGADRSRGDNKHINPV